MDHENFPGGRPADQPDIPEETVSAPVFTPVRPAPGLSVVRSLLLMLLVFVGTVDLLLFALIIHSLGLA